MSTFVSNDKSPLILSLETATRAGSISVSRGESLLAFRSGDAQASHSTHLLIHIKSVLDEAGVTLQDIDLFAVAAGPGSFTGLRIGLATAKSFAATLDRPCVGIPTLHAVAYGAGKSCCTIAMLPAGRGEVYAQRLKVSEGGDVQALEPPSHITPRGLLESVASMRRLKWAGEGAHLHVKEIEAYALSNGFEFLTKDGLDEASTDGGPWMIVPDTKALAVSVARLALLRLHHSDSFSPQNLHAIYVRASDAELNQRCQE